jgi:hypothetical protein
MSLSYYERLLQQRQQAYTAGIILADVGSSKLDSLDVLNLAAVTESKPEKVFTIFVNGENLSNYSSYEEAKDQVAQFFKHEKAWAKEQHWRIIRTDNKSNFQYQTNNAG